MTATEYVILVDEHDKQVGIAEKMEAHQKNLLHRAFSVFVLRMGPHPQILLQQRASHKYHSPDLWTNTCCSHPRPNEDILAAGQRRLVEEMGFSLPLKSLGWFHYNAHFDNGLAENEIDYVLVGMMGEGVNFKPNADEVRGYRWIGVEDLKAEMRVDAERFTPWLARALEMVEKSLIKSHAR